jgi:hypothetical protein
VADIIVEVGDEEFTARLTEEHSPHTVSSILEALPIESVAKTWGDEIYFEIPVEEPEENARASVRKGDLGYWPAGNCFCIFFGKTPMSASEEEIVPASPVNVIGSVDEPDRFKAHSAGEKVTVRRAG